MATLQKGGCQESSGIGVDVKDVLEYRKLVLIGVAPVVAVRLIVWLITVYHVASVINTIPDKISKNISPGGQVRISQIIRRRNLFFGKNYTEAEPKDCRVSHLLTSAARFRPQRRRAEGRAWSTVVANVKNVPQNAAPHRCHSLHSVQVHQATTG